MKKSLTILFILIICTFSSCSGKKEGSETIRIGEQFGLAYAPLQVMKARGFLEKLRPDIRVQWLQLGNTAAIREAVLSGDLDAGFMGIPPFLIARDKGMPWKLATGLSRAPLGLVVPEGKYRSLKNFSSKDKIALPQPGSIQHILLSMAVNRQMGDPSSLDGNLISLKHPDGMNALLSGSVQGHFTSPPYIFFEDDEPGFEILLTGEKAMGSPFTFIAGAVTEDFYEKNRDLYEDFLSAISESIEFINSNREETVNILAKVYSMDSEQLMELLYRPGMVFETDIRGLDLFIDFMHSNRYLNRQLSAESVQF